MKSSRTSKLGLLQSMLERERRFVPGVRPHQARCGPPGTQARRQGVKTAAIHGDRSQNQRNQALRGFQEGYYRVLVATDVAARGIHVDGISHVVNYDLPQVPEDFIHRVGRTGRAGCAWSGMDISEPVRNVATSARSRRP